MSVRRIEGAREISAGKLDRVVTLFPLARQPTGTFEPLKHWINSPRRYANFAKYKYCVATELRVTGQLLNQTTPAPPGRFAPHVI
jgi:hypothetical protein